MMTERTQITKEAMESEEFKKLAALHQERSRSIKKADQLIGEIIETESKLLIELTRIRSIEAEIELKSNSAESQKANDACIHELLHINESPEVRAYVSALPPLKNYPEEYQPSKLMVQKFKQITNACGNLLLKPD